MWVTSSLTNALTPTAVALGNFDGVHRGHQRVIQPVLKTKRSARGALRETKELIGNSLPLTYLTERSYTTVVTFNPHPREFFSGQPRALLTPLDEKVQQLLHLGVEQLVLLPFDRELAALSPQEFVEKILVQQLHCQQISVGQDFCFGKQRSGNATNLQAIAANFGIPVTVVPLYTCSGDRISSSSIRQALEQGDIQRAKTLMGRAYTLTGSVIKGQQLGRTIGFPTANLQLPPEKFLPRQGVYAVRVFIKEDKGTRGRGESNILTSPISLVGVMNIGCRPTVNGTQASIEVHLLDWSDDIYGKTMTVKLEKFLRPEEKFASLEALKTQIKADCAIARAVLTLEQSTDDDRTD